MSGGWGTNHTRGRGGLTAFVPQGDSRKDTAIILVGLAREYGIDQRSIRATRGGFYVTEELADLLGSEPEDEDSEGEEVTEGEEVAEGEEVSGNEEPEDTYSPGDYSVAKVKEFVTDHPELAATVLQAETEGKNRSTLVEWLNETTSGDRAAKNTAQDKE